MDNWLTILIAAAIVAALLLAVRKLGGPSPEAARALDDLLSAPGVLLIDVRSPGEFASGHIPGSHNLPGGQIEQVKGLSSGADHPIVVYCASGMRSAQSLSTLRRMGYTRAINAGGVHALAERMKVQLKGA